MGETSGRRGSIIFGKDLSCLSFILLKRSRTGEHRPPFAPQGAQIQGWGPGLPADKECGSKETALSLEYIGITTSFKNYPPPTSPQGDTYSGRGRWYSGWSPGKILHEDCKKRNLPARF